jgi:hypothetical protein
MRIPKRTAIGVSGLVFAGAAALGVAAATPASAWGCCDSSHNVSGVRVYNKNFNFSRSNSEQAQRTRQRQFGFHHDFNNFRDNNNNFDIRPPERRERERGNRW